MRRILLNLLLPLLAFAAGAQTPPPWLDLPPRPEPVYPEITVSAEELAAGGLVPFDARAAGTEKEPGVPGAVRPSLGHCADLDPGCLRTALAAAGVSGETPLVVYGETLEEAALAFLRLEAAGCQNVRVLEGGLAAWRAAGRPLSREASRWPSRPFADPSPRRVQVSPGELLGRLGDPDLEVLDLRDSGDWTENGYEAPVTFRAGHVPRSLPWDPRRGLTDPGRLPEPRAARAAFERLGPREGDRIPLRAELALYGAGPDDPSVSLGYLRLRSMDYEPRVLTGGYEGWRREGRPVARIVEADETRNLLARKTAVAIDLREPADYDQGHLPGAVLLPLHRQPELAAAVHAARPTFDRDRDPLILYCYGQDCVRSREAAAVAARQGFVQILWFREGMTAWQGAGFPVETRQAAPTLGSVSP